MQSLVFEIRKLKDGHSFNTTGPFTTAFANLQKYIPLEGLPESNGSQPHDAPGKSLEARLAAIETQARALGLADEFNAQIAEAKARLAATAVPAQTVAGTYQQAQREIRDLKERVRRLEGFSR